MLKSPSRMGLSSLKLITLRSGAIAFRCESRRSRGFIRIPARRVLARAPAGLQ
jgi:hypothetical protein